MKLNKKLAALLTATLALCMTLAALTPSVALFGKASAEPAVGAFAKAEQAGALIPFSQEDFVSRVSGDEKLEAIVVASLPEGGTLRLAGRNLERGEAIGVDSLDTLCFVPEAEAGEVVTRFSFLPVFSKTGAGREVVTVSLSLSDLPNSAPVAQDLSYQTYAGVKLCAPLKYTDADGDPCAFQVVGQPKKGEVEVLEGQFVYTPVSGKTGGDSFTYTATDDRGNVSKTATVSLEIRKRPAKDTFQYSDMQNDPGHNAALHLRDQGVFIGETIGQSNFFYPEKTVSRAEFVALVAAVTELSLPTMSVGTGLSDNADIPVWAQPYVAAAVHTGIVTGERTEVGNKIFRASDSITRAEAASIIDRSLKLIADGRGLTFADSDAVPQWAEQAVLNTAYAGILPVFGDNTVRAEARVTRTDAAQMLWEMASYIESNGKPGGLLGWFK